jgi:glycerol-3-phosphate acyltransferase PlsX
VEGAVQAARTYGVTIVLVGDESRIKSELAKYPDAATLPIEIVHTSQYITMEDKPATVGKQKPESSIHIGLDLVEKGDCQGFVSCGNTGAILAVTTLYKVKRISGIYRPALGSIVPFAGKAIILIDVGANVDSKPEWLVQFAMMGEIYAKHALKIDRPRVALLSNGEEESKGYSLIHETAPLLKEMKFHFVGNVEPKEMVKASADVFVCDGFVGNMVAKSLEAMGSIMFETLKTQIVEGGIISRLGGLILRSTFREVYKAFNPFEIGGVPLLGVNGVVVIGHGRSNALAVKNAIRQAREAVQVGVVEAIKRGLEERQMASPSESY